MLVSSLSDIDFIVQHTVHIPLVKVLLLFQKLAYKLLPLGNFEIPRKLDLVRGGNLSEECYDIEHYLLLALGWMCITAVQYSYCIFFLESIGFCIIYREEVDDFMPEKPTPCEPPNQNSRRRKAIRNEVRSMYPYLATLVCIDINLLSVSMDKRGHEHDLFFILYSAISHRFFFFLIAGSRPSNLKLFILFHC